MLIGKALVNWLNIPGKSHAAIAALPTVKRGRRGWGWEQGYFPGEVGQSGNCRLEYPLV